MANEVFDAVRTVMAIREYADREIPDDVIRRIVEAARLTASGSNDQPWHFVLVRDRDALRKPGSLVRTGPYTANAAAAGIGAYEKEKVEVGLSGAGRGIQPMLLSAWGDGVASNWAGLAGRLD